MNISLLSRLLLLAALVPLAGCADAAKSGAAKPAATAPAGPGPTRVVAPPGVFAAPSLAGVTATVGEADKGKTVHIGLGESVAVRLNVDESTGNRWFLANRLEGNVLFKKGATTYAPGSGGTVATLIYQGLHAGKQELHFYYAPPDARQNPARTADFAVIVR